MRDWYRSLEPRDRRAVLVGGGLVLVAAVWLLLLDPLYSATKTSASRYLAAEQRFGRMRAIGQNVARLGGMPARDDTPLAERIRRELRSSDPGGSGYTVSELDPRRVRLRKDAVDHHEWMATLAHLQALQIRIDHVDMQSVDGGSLLNASAVLSSF